MQASSQAHTTITVITTEGIVQTAPRPETEPTAETMRRASTLAHGFDIRSVRVHRGQELIAEQEAIIVDPNECGVFPTWSHMVKLQAEHVHDTHTQAAHVAIQRGDEAHAAQAIQAMEEAAQSYAAHSRSQRETVEAMESAMFGVGKRYSAAFS